MNNHTDGQQLYTPRISYTGDVSHLPWKCLANMLECAEILVGLIFCKDQEQNTETLQQSNTLTLNTRCEDLPHPKPKVTNQATLMNPSSWQWLNSGSKSRHWDLGRQESALYKFS